jgi:hypothetical protein
LVNPGEEGYVDDSTTILAVGIMLLIAVVAIVGQLIGLGFLATVALGVGLFVVVVAVATAVKASGHRQRFEHARGAAVADAWAPGDGGPAADVTVRPATLEDAGALARIQWEGEDMAVGAGRPYRRYERFEPALAAWLAQALASEQGDVLVEVAAGEVVAWMALDKSLDPAHPRGSGPPWPGPAPRRRR